MICIHLYIFIPLFNYIYICISVSAVWICVCYLYHHTFRMLFFLLVTSVIFCLTLATDIVKLEKLNINIILIM